MRLTKVQSWIFNVHAISVAEATRLKEMQKREQNWQEQELDVLHAW